MLKLALIGWPKISLDGNPVDNFISDKAVATLVYLVVTGETHSRDKLATLLWGELTDKRAKANLRNVIYNLQQLIGAYLEVSRKTVTFRPKSDTKIDLLQFTTAKTAAEHYALIRQTRGDLLEGFPLTEANEAFGIWLLREREILRGNLAKALQIVADDAQQRNDPQTAIEMLQKLTALEPYREQTQRTLLLLLAREGKSEQALAHYTAYQTRLNAKMGINPMPATSQLIERIQIAARQPRHNLPNERRPFFGRKQLQQTIHQQILDPQQRLITLSGAGGMGKTRLAQQVAATHVNQFLNGIIFVPLASVLPEGDPTLSVAQKINQTLTDAGFIQASEIGPQASSLIAQIAKLEMLLVLDNFEHVIEAATFVDQLLLDAPHLTILVTSRTRLNIDWEQVIDLDGLDYPHAADDDAWQTYPAVSLFVQAARRVRGNIEANNEQRHAIVTLCQLTDGMPLALELAATWARERTCDEIAQQLAQGLDILQREQADAHWPNRHRSVRVAFNYSWEQLSPQEQQVFQRLSVFQGGFSAEAAHAVAGASPMLLFDLIDQSLVREENWAGEQARYSLHELLRQFATERLQENSAETTHTLETHSNHYLGMLTEHAPAVRLYGFMPKLHAIRVDIANIEAAWAHALHQQNWSQLFIGYHVLMRYFASFSQHKTIVDLGNRLIDLLPQPDQTRFVLIVYGWTSMSNTRLGQRAQVDQIAQAIRTLNHTPASEEKAFALSSCANALLLSWRIEEGHVMSDQALAVATDANSPFDAALAIHCRGMAHYAKGMAETAIDFYQRAADQFGRLGAYVYTYSLTGIGNCHYQLGQFPQAIDYYQQALHLARQEDDRYLTELIRYNSGLWRCFIGRYVAGLVDLNKVHRERLTRGDLRGVTVSGIAIGDQLLHCKPWTEALPYLQQALRTAKQLNDSSFIITSHNAIIRAYILGGQLENAAEQLALAEQIKAGQTLRPNFVGEYFVGLGLFHAAQGDKSAAYEAWKTGLSYLREASDENPLLPRTLALIAASSLEQGNLTDAISYTDEILTFFANPHNARIDYRGMIDAVCVAVLQKAGRHDEAQTLLQTAHHRVISLAGQFAPGEERDFWLTEIEGHQAITTQGAM
ncbi:MAG: tetratricopeptide repeat protein [Candidatus Promineifilaceae bacterium]